MHLTDRLKWINEFQILGDSGRCPAANPLGDTKCGGAMSNCWSPGQNDTDCPNFGLCCFDGCANTCVDGQSMIYYIQTCLIFDFNNWQQS